MLNKIFYYAIRDYYEMTKTINNGMDSKVIQIIRRVRDIDSKTKVSDIANITRSEFMSVSGSGPKSWNFYCNFVQYAKNHTTFDTKSDRENLNDDTKRKAIVKEISNLSSEFLNHEKQDEETDSIVRAIIKSARELSRLTF